MNGDGTGPYDGVSEPPRAGRSPVPRHPLDITNNVYMIRLFVWRRTFSCSILFIRLRLIGGRCLTGRQSPARNPTTSLFLMHTHRLLPHLPPSPPSLRTPSSPDANITSATHPIQAHEFVLAPFPATASARSSPVPNLMPHPKQGDVQDEQDRKNTDSWQEAIEQSRRLGQILPRGRGGQDNELKQEKWES